MARTPRDTNLETRTARARLKDPKKRVWRNIVEGLAVGYRKGINGGTWYLRIAQPGNKYSIKALGSADDFQEADGLTVLTYGQAVKQAQQKAAEVAQKARQEACYTVNRAMDDYLEAIKVSGRSYATSKATIDAHIKPEFGDRPVDELTTKELRQWHHKLARAPARLRGKDKTRKVARDDSEGQRKRKATANRILTVFKAALNHAWREGDIANADAWRKVSPFKNVDVPKIRYLSEAECTRLINASAADLRQLVRAALLTGCRYGELGAMQAHDFNLDNGTVLVRPSKSGKTRHIPLTAEGQQFFERATAGKTGKDLIFAHDNGEPWGKSHQSRPMREACEAAKIEPSVSFHVLRHTYGSLLAMRGVPLQVIASAMGHADTRMTEKHYAHLLPSYIADTIRAHLPSFGYQADNVTKLL